MSQEEKKGHVGFITTETGVLGMVDARVAERLTGVEIISTSDNKLVGKEAGEKAEQAAEKKS